MNTRIPAAMPELWGGVECTINRVEDSYSSQLAQNGHANRPEDLDQFASLGIQALRYPILWEQFAPDGDTANIDWSWATERLEQLRSLGVRPIVGLVHHGSGPRDTGLAEPCFAEKLARFAAAVAERFPWVREWTPVNEPLTTARFSGLYGHWYPHGKSERVFARALVNECRATVLAMQAIRRVNPGASLIQTEDLGKTHATPHMRYQADFENERRWLSWDLLCGRVVPGHQMWGHLLWAGIAEAELQEFLERPCPPAVLGINYYLTSERYLDEERHSYPERCIGTNGRDHYADVEAVRVLPENIQGPAATMEEAWLRYGIPVAITEAHLGCTREEQMRWLLEVWDGARRLGEAGADVRAITAWALLGSFDWDSMLTRFRGHYEPGVFDVRGGRPRPTALASMMRTLASGERPVHPVLAAPGWWRRHNRLLYHPSRRPSRPTPGSLELANLPFNEAQAPPVLITGAETAPGRAFERLCNHRHLTCIALSGSDLDITDPASVEAALKRYKPWAVINTADCADLDAAQADEARCYRENTGGPALLAAICARRQVRLLTLSSDQVFNGRQDSPYVESDPCTPVSVFGRSKAKAERSVLEIMPDALVVRPGALFCPWDSASFVTVALRQIAAGNRYEAVDNVTVSPTYLPDLVHACLDLLIDGERGVWHLANGGAVTWRRFAQMAAERAGLDSDLVVGRALRASRHTARRPLFSVLGSERGQLLQPLPEAIDCYLRDCGIRWSESRPAQHERRGAGREERSPRGRGRACSTASSSSLY